MWDAPAVLTDIETYLLSLPLFYSSFFPQGCYHFSNCVNHWSEWLLSMAPGFVVGGNKGFDLIWFFSFREVHWEDFLQTTTALYHRQRGYALNKQTDHRKWSMCVHVADWSTDFNLYVSVFSTLCAPSPQPHPRGYGWGQICPLADWCLVQHSWAPATGGVVRTHDLTLALEASLVLAFSGAVCRRHTV